MSVKLAINGFGRIGRLVLRALAEQGRDDLEVVAINDLGSVEMNAHLLEFDSVHGRFPGTVTYGEDWMDVGRGKIAVTAMRNPDDLPWAHVDIVLECTGIFKGDKALVHLGNGSSRVLVSAPSSGAHNTVVYGVNHNSLTSDHVHVSNASCTTNCLAPVAKVLHETVGIVKGFMTTVHSYTGDQPTLDRLHKKDFYRARAAAMSMIPTTTGAAKAVGLVLPELAGRLDGVAIRVPTPNVSCVDLTIEAARATDADEINAAIHAAAHGPLRGVLGVTDKPLVSVDFNHAPESSTFATDQTRVMDGNMVRILSWYDNEWGFSNRMLDTAAEMGKHL
ncbi:Glyceraldehyde-3-phosphate dehydrogenase 1 [Aliiroseovarius sp. xm-m-379]|uniref:type I glyceraldehyde-3-phosphate dehydrogenase n=1 Tax=unclassified Aliiroseovarius TaxID=2623558 RepID=UPI00156A1A3D|nr:MULTISPECIES: type I glyceraldehyde-3-phosphate dehydrogenase [unclassified Aliiroseovarius]NRP12453.1 Glyceraldehyde-3-phosphate dehydrogenase 1 [Aliiroseovarius sp. xm-d-517]NRP24827.1 Glyceraldehyde-3-phosphate dehydrogenase 1 [Aliiroseovarius sp. xm-m-379]NRP30538.1 Glyceraldehyde-3-phosphate dehydrogenase 1 [Aliiroseovarius sp. xm-m-314]NRP33626.1 Glyceraldehyde-3-phosphate dehydrogenase 1 [Aliiroseovarius sp. xm-a-104]NRP40733.1 Glyceraldehyde-3-phosphate dehydrogenase 1 [Aliiroseovar